MRMYLTIISVTILFLMSSNRFRVENLESHQVAFGELPKEIQNSLLKLSNTKHYLKKIADSQDLKPRINSNLISLDGEFTLEDEKLGPWTSSKTLTDKNRGIIYRIKAGTPSPLIIHNNMLFIPNDYNILHGNRITKAIFTRYSLLNTFSAYTSKLVFYISFILIVFLALRQVGYKIWR